MNPFFSSPTGAAGRLSDYTAFGPNPGNLHARLFVPADLAPGAALVVALHGCTQTADGYDRGTGWSTLAERAGFAVLFPEQQRANNPNLCFNWFTPGDLARDGGEAASIAAMVRAAVADHALDPTRVFVTGLSAGGAMTAVMLATWPELFAGGAIIAGLPYATATGVPDALARMRGQGGVDDAALTAAVLNASARTEATRWPAVSIWHGTADGTVSATNMARLGAQWRGVHKITGDAVTTSGAGWTRRAWLVDGRSVVEEWAIAGMDHGVPIDGRDGLGQIGPHMLDMGVGSTALIAQGWGLIDADTLFADKAVPDAARLVTDIPPPTQFGSIQNTIESALRSAGLMR